MRIQILAGAAALCLAVPSLALAQGQTSDQAAPAASAKKHKDHTTTDKSAKSDTPTTTDKSAKPADESASPASETAPTTGTTTSSTNTSSDTSTTAKPADAPK